VISRKLKFVADPSKGKVSAILEIPDSADALLVLGHGAGAGMYHANLANIAEALQRQRIATFRYQFPFRERGGGRDSKQVSLATVKNACDRAAHLAPDLPLFAGGHSFGGRMTSLAAAEGLLPPLQGLVFFAFPLHPPGKPSVERAQHLSEIQQPMLFLSGTRDKLFTIELFKPILSKLKPNADKRSAPANRPRASLHLLDTADHGYKTLKRTRHSEESVFDEMARVTREWID
jgi:predicted alpha/beta-hydrolase family hydrolase